MNDTTLKKGIDYEVAFANNKNVGTAKVTITGIGTYKGTKTATFKIVPKATKITSLKALKRGFRANWKKASAQVSGYQIRYSPKKSMAGAKSKLFKSKAKIAFKKTALKASKKYYVQVRTYKTVGGKRYYSAWSAKKSVKTLKR